MKKALIVVFALLMSACSTNDDSNVVNQDPIIGVWQPVREVAVFDDGHEVSEAVSICERKNRVTFQANGHFFMTDYPESDDPNCMEQVGNLYLSGQWMQMSKHHYHFEMMCAMHGCDDSITEIPDAITFPTPNLMHIRENDDDPTDDIDHFYLEFERVE